MAWFVYVIKSEKDGRLYKGMSEDLKVRVATHKLIFPHHGGFKFLLSSQKPIFSNNPNLSSDNFCL